MKRLITLAIFVPIIALCTTYNTISVNGSNSDWESDEDLVTTSVGYTDYFTWDASNLYFAIGGSDADTDNKVHFIYIDTDPQTTATNGTGTTSSIAWNLTHTLPFTANYAFAYKVQSGDDYYNLRKYTTSWQSDQTYSGSVSIGTDLLEVSIPWSEIGSPSQVYIVIFMQNDDGSWTWSGTPSTAFTDGSGDQTMSHYYGYNITSGVSPDASGNVDQSLPVELSAFSAYSSSKGVKLTWTTDSEIENHGFIILRKSDVKAWAEIASFTKYLELEGQGSTTEATDYYFVDSQVKEGWSYSYQLADVDYQGKKTYHKDHIQSITYVNPGKDTKPGVLKVVKLYPNPFNPTVTLTYDLAEMNDLYVSIYNLAGEQVWNHAKGNHPAGQDYTLSWNGNDMTNAPLPSGIYLVNIQTGTQIKSEKVTLLR